MRFALFGLSLFLCTFARAEEASEFIHAQAEFDAGLYEAAIPRFEGLLKGGETLQLSLIRSELAYSYLQIGDPKQTIALFENQLLTADDLYLLGAAYQTANRPNEAIPQLEAYLSQSGQLLRFRDSAELQLGFAFLDCKELNLAEKHLLAVSFDPDQPELFVTARLQCARLAFKQGNRQLADERLQSITNLLSKQHPLNHEYAFVRGEMLVQMQEYAEAIPWLEKALPKRNISKAKWTPDTLHALGLAYMHLNKNPDADLAQAEKYLLQAQENYPSEKGILALGQCYLCRGKYFNDPEALKKGEQLLSPSIPFSSPQLQAQALLLRAEIANPEESTKLFAQARPLFEQAREKDEIAYLYGVSALRLNDNDLNTSLVKILQEGLDYSPTGKLAPSLLLMLGKVHQKRNDHQAAEEAFAKLTGSFPKSPFSADAWYLAANSAEILGKDPDEILTYRRYVYEQFPNSPLAPEAYFKSYSYRDYVQGDRKAMHHLQEMQTNFPQSPFTINALYLLGLDYLRDRKTPEGRWIRKRSLTTAIDCFQQCESLFNQLFSKGQIPAELLPYYTYLQNRAILERALANYVVAEESSGAKRQIFLDYAIEVFQKIAQNTDHQENAQLIEEAEFGLAQAYLKARKEAEAEAVLDKMLNQYKSAQVTRNYFLSRVWYEKGLIAMRQESYLKAIEAFTLADESGKGNRISADQQLEGWIQISLCYRAMHQLDEAMLTLSKVINENVISSLRIKAMFLRAEIYELQNRADLARKQLESTSKKGGEWALRAQEKLKQEYYYD